MNRLSIKERLLRLRRHSAIRRGDLRHCRTGQWELLDQLFAGLPRGVFFEAGAHDGWTGSNTYWLEARHGWSGVLVEPVPGLFRACRKERPNAMVFHGALVAPDDARATVEIECSGLVSTLTDSPIHRFSITPARPRAATTGPRRARSRKSRH